ncbi:hypothetical protein G6F56_008580 [Rhizopus delemar]|nr:hypothetical protein G6F56_008580 [Rhizopus delemar]
MRQTAYLHLSQDDPLFFCYLDQNKRSPRSAHSSTVANWLKSVLKKSGVDTDIYKAHSFRSAAATKATSTGTPVPVLKEAVNWSLHSYTCERFYFKPDDQHQKNAERTRKFFGSSGVEAEATMKDVVWSHPIFEFISSLF